jgi:hypothetical protein
LALLALATAVGELKALAAAALKFAVELALVEEVVAVVAIN